MCVGPESSSRSVKARKPNHVIMHLHPCRKLQLMLVGSVWNFWVHACEIWKTSSQFTNQLFEKRLCDSMVITGTCFWSISKWSQRWENSPNDVFFWQTLHRSAPRKKVGTVSNYRKTTWTPHENWHTDTFENLSVHSIRRNIMESSLFSSEGCFAIIKQNWLKPDWLIHSKILKVN